MLQGLKTTEKPRWLATLNATGMHIEGTLDVLFVDQNVDPGSTSGVIDVDCVLTAIDSRYDGQRWGMLDFEVPYDRWFAAGFGTQPQNGAASTLAALIRAVRDQFPSVGWTYYGIPGLSYYPNGKLWVTASADEQFEERTRQIMNYAKVMAECDWLAPCIYDIQRNATQRPQDVAINAANEIAYRRARIKVCRDFLSMSGTPKPVIPCVCPLYCDGGNVPEYRVIPPSEYESDQIAVCREVAHGACIWLAPQWMTSVACANYGSSRDQASIREMLVRDLLDGKAPESWPSAGADVSAAFAAMLDDRAKISGGVS